MFYLKVNFMDERNIYNDKYFEVSRHSGKQGDLLLVNFPEGIKDHLPVTEIYRKIDGLYLGKIVKVSFFSNKNPDLIYDSGEEKPIGFFVNGKVEVPGSNFNLDETKFTNSIDFLVAASNIPHPLEKQQPNLVMLGNYIIPINYN